jgi:hypothetical protein
MSGAPSKKSGCSDQASDLPFSVWVIAGLALLGLHAALTWLSGEFEYTRPLADKPILTLVALQIAAGAVFLATIFRAKGAIQSNRWFLPWLIGVGIALRAVTMFSAPMLETDFYRYMWDGAVLANGMNPYQYAPDQAARATDSALAELAKESGEVIDRINYPHLRTVYPPLAQAIFAAAYLVKPWSLLAWRVTLAFFDAATLLLLLMVLRNLNLPYTLAAIYWWNPLVIREVFNTAHMDVLALPLVIAAVMLSTGTRQSAAALALAGATGIKLWPVVLLPVILSPLWSHPRRIALPVGLFAAVCFLMFLPIHFSGLDQTSGFTAYGQGWEMNDALYMLLLWIVELLGRVFAWGGGMTQLVTRAIVAAAVVVWTAWLSMRGPTEQIDVWERSLLVVSAVFLLSPTQFPWYYLWMLPFLTIRPRFSLLLLSALLALYYLRFHFKSTDRAWIFDYYVVWLEYVPVWILLWSEWFKARSANTVPAQEESFGNKMRIF